MQGLRKVLKVLQLSRAHFVAGGALLFLAGGLWAALVGAPFSLGRFLLGFLVLFPAHLAVSYSNDYFDAETDGFGRPNFISGGSGVLVAHPELRGLARGIALGLMALSLGMGILFILTYAYSPWFLAYVVGGNLLGWCYSAPPVRLSCRGLGEVATTFTLGWLVPGMGYVVVAGRFTYEFLLLGLFLTLYGLAFILTVEIPDMEADWLSRKRTLVVRRGRVFAFRLIEGVYLLATVLFFALAAIMEGHWRFDLAVLGLFSLLPLGVGGLGALRPPQERRPATRLATATLIAYAAFVALVDVYLGYRVLGT